MGATGGGAGAGGAGEQVGCGTLRRWTGFFKPNLAKSIFPSLSIRKEGLKEGHTLKSRASHDG
jgi:hypothetical protein